LQPPYLNDECFVMPEDWQWLQAMMNHFRKKDHRTTAH
jgi:hypothetical protein